MSTNKSSSRSPFETPHDASIWSSASAGSTGSASLLLLDASIRQHQRELLAYRPLGIERRHWQLLLDVRNQRRRTVGASYRVHLAGHGLHAHSPVGVKVAARARGRSQTLKAQPRPGRPPARRGTRRAALASRRVGAANPTRRRAGAARTRRFARLLQRLKRPCAFWNRTCTRGC
jgi:hypothetical protein